MKINKIFAKIRNKIREKIKSNFKTYLKDRKILYLYYKTDNIV